MVIPSLDHFEVTGRSLHKMAMLLGLVRLLSYEPLTNYLELGMKVVPQGLSTDTLQGGGELILDFKQRAFIYHPRTGTAVTFPFTGQTQADIVETVLAALESTELNQALVGMSGHTALERAVQAAHTRARFTHLDSKEYTDTMPLEVDANIASDYADVLYTIFTATARFRARLTGLMTPIVVWPEHFDLSTLWFHPENTEMEANKAHLNFGFAPYSLGLERPYLYAYAYPYPEHYTPPLLPAGAIWHTTGWTGVVVSYDEIVQQAEPALYVEQMLVDIFKALCPLIGLS